VKKLYKIRLALFFLAAFAGGAKSLPAQEQSPAPDAKPAANVLSAPRPKAQAASKDEHRFWDNTNDWLFAGIAAARTLDYFSTLNMRRRGRQEILLTNDAVDNHAPSPPLKLQEPACRSAPPTYSTVTDTTNWSAGFPSCISDWQPRAPCATTASRHSIPRPPRLILSAAPHPL
jgi:hypothetical protein